MSIISRLKEKLHSAYRNTHAFVSRLGPIRGMLTGVVFTVGGTFGVAPLVGVEAYGLIGVGSVIVGSILGAAFLRKPFIANSIYNSTKPQDLEYVLKIHFAKKQPGYVEIKQDKLAKFINYATNNNPDILILPSEGVESSPEQVFKETMEVLNRYYQNKPNFLIKLSNLILTFGTTFFGAFDVLNIINAYGGHKLVSYDELTAEDGIVGTFVVLGLMFATHNAVSHYLSTRQLSVGMVNELITNFNFRNRAALQSSTDIPLKKYRPRKIRHIEENDVSNEATPLGAEEGRGKKYGNRVN